jgi:hypothetical protein
MLKEGPNRKKAYAHIRAYLPHNPKHMDFSVSYLFFDIVNLLFEKLCFVFETVLIFLGIYSGVPCLILTELLLDTAVAAAHPSTTREKIIAKNFYILFLSLHKKMIHAARFYMCSMRAWCSFFMEAS